MVGLLFLLSGLSGLLYEVLWTRRLTLTFGHTVLAVSTVVTAFMLGLCLGSLRGGIWADRHRDPCSLLRQYALLEAFIGVWGLLSLPLLGLVERSYISAATRGASPGLLSAICLLGSLLVLVPPTAAMGATLPVICRAVAGPSSLAILYGVNTLGACWGALLGGYVLLPWLGLQSSVWLAASLNLALGAVGWALSHLNFPAIEEELPPLVDEPPPPTSTEIGGSPGWILLAFGLAGVAAMTFQVGWTRALILTMGSSVYAFSAILATFLAGIGLGSLIYPLLFKPGRVRTSHLAWIELGGATLGGLTIPVLGVLPYLFVWLFPWTQESFSNVLLLQLSLAALILLGPTLLMGMAFPLATEILGSSRTSFAVSLSRIYSANTLGCIAGAALSGFVAVPLVGAQGTLKLAVTINLLASLILFWSARRRWPTLLVVFLGGLNWLLPTWNPALMSGGVAVYAGVGRSVEALAKGLKTPAFYRDGVSSTVSVHVSLANEVYMAVNGKVDASTHSVDKQTMYLTGYLPGILHAHPRRAAVIGLGAGMTLQALSGIPELESIECAELEPAVVEAGRYWAGHNGHVLSNPKVSVRVSDGRTFIMGSPHRFDIIASEPSNPWIAGVGNLFTQDFYRSCKERLNSGGLMCQWFNLYNVSRDEIDSVLFTFFSVFPHGSVWLSAPGDILLIGSETELPVDLARVRKVMSLPANRENLLDLGLYQPEAVLGHFLMTRDEALATAGPATPNTDDRPILEFLAPRYLYRSGLTERNLEYIQSLHRGTLPPGVAETPELVVTASQAWFLTGDVARLHRLTAEVAIPGAKVVAARLRAVQSKDTATFQVQLEAACAETPSDPTPAMLLARLQQNRGDFVQAAALYEKLLALKIPGWEGALNLQMGSSLIEARQFKAARKALSRAVVLLESSFAPDRLGAACQADKDYPAALEAYTEAAKRNPADALARMGQGHTLMALKRMEEASRAYREVIQLIPEDVVAWLNLGVCLAQLNRRQESIQAFRKVLRISPTNAEARRNLEILTP